MKYIYLNLKRFDIPKEFGGVNNIAPVSKWAEFIIGNTKDKLSFVQNTDFKVTMFFPEAHLLNAVSSLGENGVISVGSQGVFRQDTSFGGNFGAFTTNRTANSVKAMGCTDVLIGHCEERKDILGIIEEAGVSDSEAVNRILNREVLCAQKAGLNVLYCIGESFEEMDNYKNVLSAQLATGLANANLSNVVIAYEPVWAIGPGKTPPDKDYIQKIGRFIKETTGGLPVVYGGGLKKENSAMIASIPEIDGGLVALTRFGEDFGFYPEEFLEIVKIYFEEVN